MTITTQCLYLLAVDSLIKYLLQQVFIFFRYLSCVSQTMKKLQPFGDVPKKLTEQLRRSFVATRTFAQALMQGKHVVNKILKVRETQGRARPVHDIQVPGDGNKREPERENWPCRVMLPILPIQSISGSRLSKRGRSP